MALEATIGHSGLALPYNLRIAHRRTSALSLRPLWVNDTAGGTPFVVNTEQCSRDPMVSGRQKATKQWPERKLFWHHWPNLNFISCHTFQGHFLSLKQF